MDDQVERYEADTEFPGYGLDAAGVERFWRISAQHLEQQQASALYARLKRLSDECGPDADDMLLGLTGDTVSDYISDYEKEEERWGGRGVRSWHEYLVRESNYLPDNYSGPELERIWAEETRWFAWEHVDKGGCALDAVSEILSGYPTFAEWVEAAR